MNNSTYRLYREEGLSIRPKLPKRKRACRYRQGRPEIPGPNEVWAMDFVSDQLFDGRPFRILAVVDCHTREALSTVPRVSVRAYQMVEALDDLVRARGRPQEPTGGQRTGVRWPGAGPVGLPERGRAGLQPAREAHQQRIHRGLQRPPASRMPERVLVPVHGGRPRPDRALEKGLQRATTSYCPGRLDASGLRRPSSPSPETCIKPGPNSGSGPLFHEPCSRADHFNGGGSGGEAC